MRQTLNQKIVRTRELVRHLITGTIAEVVGYADGKIVVEVTKAPASHPNWYGERWSLASDEIDTFWRYIE